MPDGPWTAYQQQPAAQGPWSAYASGTPQTSNQKTQPTSISGVVASLARGAAPYAAGAALGAAAGAPLAGVGAVPGAVAGIGATALTEFGGNVYDWLAGKLGAPHVTTPSEATDRALSALGVKAPSTPIEHAAEETSGLVASMGAPAGELSTAERIAATNAYKATEAENQARTAVSRQFARGSKAGAPSAPDVLEEFTKARAEGQPYALIDVPNAPLAALAGTTYRQDLASRQLVKDFLTSRKDTATGRVEDIIDRQLTQDPYRATALRLAEVRSEKAKPLFDEVRRGGSLAPLTTQFEKGFRVAAAEVAKAQGEVAEAQRKLTQAQGRAATAHTDVYTQRSVNEAVRGAQGDLVKARSELTAAASRRQAQLARLRKAQEDGTANAPGAIWSPRLQEFLDTPEVQRGIRRGFAIERRNAVGAGTPFNPKEYAIVGYDKSGDPIVGAAPNMALLQVAKEGLDAILQSPKMRDPLSGRLNKTGRSYQILRNGLVDELDILNPLYRQARNVWAGDSDAMEALRLGKDFMSAKRSPEELAETIGKMGDSERQFFTIGVADALKSKLFRAGDSADKGRSLIRNEDTRMRLRALFKSDALAQRFIDSLEREHVMAQTGSRVVGGSQTAERVMDDTRAAETAMRAAHGIASILHGYWYSALLEAMRMHRMFAGRVNPAVTERIARLLTAPNAPLSATGDILPATGGTLPPSVLSRVLPGALAVESGETGR